MAATSRRMCLGLLMVLVTVSVFLARPSYGLRSLVGAKSEVPDVESNQELQELGRYCVEEFNMKGGENEWRMMNPLVFIRVVEAQKQVVSGDKYFLKIQVTLPDRTTSLFSSIVVVKPWLQSRELLHFSPISNLSSSK